MTPPGGEQSAEEASLDIGGVLDELAVEGSGDHEDLRGEVEGAKLLRHETAAGAALSRSDWKASMVSSRFADSSGLSCQCSAVMALTKGPTP